MNSQSRLVSQSIIEGAVWDKVYSLDNYLVEDISKQSNRCIIYFSSSGIYYPNTEEALTESIIKKNTYEWYSTRVCEADRHIFVRDVAKQFYVRGISERCSSIDALIDLLKELTTGYEVITIGSSGGGYMACLAGVKLQAKMIYCFSAFFDLNQVDYSVWNLLERYKNSPTHRKYYNLLPLLEGNDHAEIVYVFPALNRDEVNNDYLQNVLVKDIQHVHVLPIKTTEHGVCMSKRLLLEFINLPQENTLSLVDGISKMVSEKELARLIEGLYGYYLGKIRRNVKRLFQQ